MKTAAYCRYSSDKQRESSIRDQLRNIEAHCDRMGWPMPELYKDEAISGARSDRPGYQAMLEAVMSGKMDVLLVDDISRLSRDSIESARAVRMLKHRGVRIIGVSDGIDTSRQGYKIETGLRSLMSDLYLDDLAEKTRRGLTGQALDGYSAGGLPYGYASASDGRGYKRVIIDDQAAIVRRIFDHYAQGYSPRDIAARLNADGIPSPRGGKWQASAIYGDGRGLGLLNNETYIGRQVWNKSAWVKDPESGKRQRIERPISDWIIHTDESLRIIEQAVWDAVKARQTRTRTDITRRAANSRGAGKSRYLFSGLLKCACCGSAYIIVNAERYGCALHKSGGSSACANSVTVKRSTVESVLLEDIKRELMSENAYRDFEREVRRLLKAAQPDPAAARADVASAKASINNILSAIRAGIISKSLSSDLAQAERELEGAQARLHTVENFAPTQILPRAREIYRRMVQTLEAIEDIEPAREALRSILGDEIRLVPEDGGLYAEMKKASHTASLSQIVMVAGAGFEPTTFGL